MHMSEQRRLLHLQLPRHMRPHVQPASACHMLLSSQQTNMYSKQRGLLHLSSCRTACAIDAELHSVTGMALHDSAALRLLFSASASPARHHSLSAAMPDG